MVGRPEQKLQGELALVTGGGGGLGRLMSLRLSKLGVDIVIWDIKQEGTFPFPFAIKNDNDRRVIMTLSIEHLLGLFIHSQEYYYLAHILKKMAGEEKNE